MRTIYNPFTKRPQLKIEDDANFEELTDDSKILVPGVDPKYQFLTVGGAGGANRIITLNTTNAKKGDRFIIRNNEDGRNGFYIEVQPPGGTWPLERLYTRTSKGFIYDGTNWIGIEVGTGRYGPYENVGMGYSAKAQECSVAIGGRSPEAYQDSVAIGYGSKANNRAMALGYETTSEYDRSTALGYYSKCTRTCELAINIEGNSTQDGTIVIGGWYGETEDNTPTEIYCGDEFGQYFTIKEKSSLAFKITVVARDNTANESAMYTFEGLIHRDGANNTVLDVCNKTVIHEDDDTWDCDVTADDTYDVLIITVTGDVSNTVRWAARLDGVESKRY